MNKDYKKISTVVLIGFILIFLTGFQIAFINRFILDFNIFLILILFLILIKNIYGAIFFAWFGGFLTDTVHFSEFGITSIIFLLLTAFLIFFQKKALITAKTEGILLMSVLAIFFYHFLEWIINNLWISKQEKFSFYFFNGGIIAELLLMATFITIMFYVKGIKN